MIDTRKLQKDRTEAILLLQSLTESLSQRDLKQNLTPYNNWIYNLQEETIPTLIIDELNHVYTGLSRLTRFSKFSDLELGLVSRIIKITGNYDSIEKLW